MRKAIITGLITGVIISLLLIGGTYLRRYLPDTFTANLLFLIVFVGSIVTVLWLSLNHYCRNSAIKWLSLGATGIIASLIASGLVTMHGFMYSGFYDKAYLTQIMHISKEKWKDTNEAAESIIGGWFRTPIDSALYNFRDLIVLLMVTSLIISIVFYLFNRKRSPNHNAKEDHELIF